MWSLDSSDPARRQFDWVDDFEYETMYSNPDLAISFVLEVLSLNPDNKIQEVLAAGPLETLLVNHGEAVIDKIEHIAKSNPAFASLLGGVWQSDIPGNIWKRIMAVRNMSGWDGNP